MKMPEPTTQEIMDQVLASMQPQITAVQRHSTDTAITTPGALACVITAAVCWSAITPLWLLLAVPLAIAGWGTEMKWWRR